MNYAERYRRAIESLTRTLSMEDGLPEAEIEAGEQRLGIRLPAALRVYYQVAGGFDQLNQVHNRLYAPDQWELQDGKLLFMEENQNVVVWAVEVSDASPEDPPVLQGVVTEDTVGEWHLEHESCAEFLTLMLYLHGVFGGMEEGYEGFMEISEEELAQLRNAWPRIGQMKDMEVFGKEGQALCVLGGEAPREMYVGARSEADMASLEEELESILGMEIDAELEEENE